MTRTHDLVDVELLLRMDNPVAFSTDKDGEWIWLPRSQIEFSREKDSMCTVTMPEWLAIEKELV